MPTIRRKLLYNFKLDFSNKFMNFSAFKIGI